MRNSTSPLKPYETTGTDSILSSNPLSNASGTSITIPQRDSSVTLNYNNSLSRGNRGYGGGYGSSYGGGYGGSNYGSSYGGYGGGNRGYGGSGYGSGSYGGYGGGYGGNRGGLGYGGGYGGGGYGNNSRFGDRGLIGPNGEMNKDSEGGFVDNTMHWINKIQNTTDVLAQFTGLIMMNAEAIYTSYSSFIGLLEGFSHLGYILSGFTFLRWLIGRKKEITNKDQPRNPSNPFVNEFQIAKKSPYRQWTSVIVIIGLFVVGLPLLTYLYKKMHELVDDDEDEQNKEGEAPWKPKIGIAIADYKAAGPDDIEFMKGDQILVISKPFAEWWEGEVYSRGQGPLQRGLFPFNFIEFVHPQQGVG
jgi:peroxin-13